MHVQNNTTGPIPPGYDPAGGDASATGKLPPRSTLFNLTPEDQLRFSSLLTTHDPLDASGHGGLFITGRGDGAEGGNVANIAGQLDRLSSSEMSIDIYTVLATIQRLAQEQRSANREVRTSELQAQVSSLMNAASEMRNAANLRFAAAIVQGAMQIAGGAVQIAQSSQALANQVKSARLEHQATKDMNASRRETNIEAKQGLRNAAAMYTEQSKQAAALGTHQQALAGANSQIMSSLGSMIAAGINLAADHADAHRAELEADAKIHETAVQHANDMMQQMMDVIRDVRDKLGAIEQSRIETNRGIARNI